MVTCQSYKVAYLLLVHKLPKQVRRLIERLQFEGSAFWIHVDAKADAAHFVKELLGLENVYFIKNRFNGDWGWFPFVQANIEGIKAIDDSGYGYDHLIILSGQDYLLCNNADLINFLHNHRESSFVQHVPVTSELNPHVSDRVTKYHVKLPLKKKIVYPYSSKALSKRLINEVLNISGKYPLPRIIPGDRQLYFGSNWMRFTKKAVRFLIERINAEPDYTAYFKSTCLAEEHFFHTLLLNANEEERGPIINNNFTFCHWKRASELYPVPLNMSDIDNLLQSGDLLARKFDCDFETEILDFLDRKFA
jgi:hypothetical protein